MVMRKKDRVFSEAFTMYYPLIYNIVCLKVSDRDDADDITQAVFLSYYPKMDEVVNVRKWLFGAVRLEVMNFYRKKGSDTVDIDTLFEDAALSFVNGFRDTRVIIEQAIESITDDTNRAIFELVAIQNYTYQETGNILGFSSRRVKYHYHLIIKEILRYLNEKGIKNIEDLL